MEQRNLFTQLSLPDVGPLRDMAEHMKMKVIKSEWKEPEAVFFRVMKKMEPIVNTWVGVEAGEISGPAIEDIETLLFFGNYRETYHTFKWRFARKDFEQ